MTAFSGLPVSMDNASNWPRIAHQYHPLSHPQYLPPQQAIVHRILHFPTAPDSAVKHSQCSVELTCGSLNFAPQQF